MPRRAPPSLARLQYCTVSFSKTMPRACNSACAHVCINKVVFSSSADASVKLWSCGACLCHNVLRLATVVESKETQPATLHAHSVPYCIRYVHVYVCVARLRCCLSTNARQHSSARVSPTAPRRRRTCDLHETAFEDVAVMPIPGATRRATTKTPDTVVRAAGARKRGRVSKGPSDRKPRSTTLVTDG